MQKRRSAEGGFILLETMVAITIVTIIMTALTTLFVSVIGSTSHQRNSQAASQVAETTVDYVRAMGAATAVLGRGSSAVTTQFAGVTPATASMPATAAAVAPWIAASTMTQATSTDTPPTVPLPTTATAQVVNNLTFETNYYVGLCYRLFTDSDAGTDAACTATQPSGTFIQYTRVVVVVAWNGQGCTPFCSYISAVLLDGHTDPVFDLNQAPPPQPAIKTIPTELSAVGDTVNGLPGVAGGLPTALTGVPQFTWSTALSGAGSLPLGLAMNGAGLITGSPTTTGTYNVTVTLTDSFLHTATATFTWTIVPPLVVTDPGAQAAVVGTPVSVPMAATGGVAPYTWSASGLPSGLSINAGTGTITGTPTAAGIVTSSVTVTDSSGTRKNTLVLGWTVHYPPMSVAAQSAQAGTVGYPITPLPVNVSGGSGSFSWSATNLPNGLSINPGTGLISGTPTATGSFPVTVTVTDTGGPDTASPMSVSFSWTVNPLPILTTPGTQSGEVGVALSVPASVKDGTGPFTAYLSCNPGGATATVPVSGSAITVTPPVLTAGSLSCTETVVDSSGATATSGSFTWNVIAAPAISVPDQTTAYSTKVSLTVGATGGKGSYRYSESGLPDGLSMSTAGVISGTTANTASQNTVTVTVTDSAGGTGTTTFNWWVSNLALPIADQSTLEGGAVSMTIAATGGTGPYSYAASGLPSGLSLARGKVTGTVPATPSTSTVTVTATDSTGAFVSTTFTWNVSEVAVSSPGNQTTRHGHTASSVNMASYVSGGTGPYTYAASGLAGSGLSINTRTGVIGGTAGGKSAEGTYPVVVTVTDSTRATATTSFNWTVS